MNAMKCPATLKQACRVRQVWRAAWLDYGGWRAMLTSPYLWISVALAAGCYPMWLGSEWRAISISAIPSLLGFSIGGFAIFLAFGDERFRILISGPDENGKLSPFLSVAVQFAHFVTVQAIALLYAVIATPVAAFGCGPVDVVIAVIGVIALFYSLALALAAFASLLKLARSYDGFAAKVKKPQGE